MQIHESRSRIFFFILGCFSTISDFVNQQENCTTCYSNLSVADRPSADYLKYRFQQSYPMLINRISHSHFSNNKISPSLRSNVLSTSLHWPPWESRTCSFGEPNSKYKHFSILYSLISPGLNIDLYHCFCRIPSSYMAVLSTLAGIPKCHRSKDNCEEYLIKS